MQRRTAFILEVALIEIVAANAFYRGKVVQPVTILGRVRTDAEVPDADVTGVVAGRLKHPGERRNVPEGLVLVVDHTVAPAVAAG